jgi:predicted DNA-binding transcriptional regulator YafY
MLVQGDGAWTPARLADECGVGERTIYRDLNELERIGVPLRFDQGENRYRVDGDFFLPPVQLTAEEALALSVLCEHVAEPERIPFTRPAWQAMAKIQASLPPELRDELLAANRSIVIQTAASVDADGFSDIYDAMCAAIAERRTLVCEYESLSGESDGEEFDFEPYTLYFSVRAWYVVGFHHGRGELRTLKINRFLRAARTHRTYEIPADFSLDRHLGNAWRMIRGGTDYDVAIRFNAAFAETVSDTRWHATQEIEHHEDGSCTFRCTVSGLDEIVWWVLSMGPNCTVLEPSELRDRVRDASARTAMLYETDDAPNA